MSAIVGIIEPKHPVDVSVLDRMLQILHYRGSDDAGYKVFQTNYPVGSTFQYAGVGVDVQYSKSKMGNSHQPVESEDGNVILAFDGEIYNTEELWSEFEAQSKLQEHYGDDADLLMRMYLSYGLEKTLNRLDGMWAICIADLNAQKIILVRDKLGEKPLYYYNAENVFLFASEYKAFYCHPSFKPVLDQRAVSEYFVFRYPCGDTTFLENVKSLAPGCYLELSPLGMKQIQYWELPVGKYNSFTHEENKDIFRNLIRKSVKRRLCGDNAIGAQLSGGVDSSYLCAVTKQLYGKGFNTYSITYEGIDNSIDESKYVDFVNEKLQLHPHKYNCKPIDFLKDWERSTWHFEAPLNHEGSVPLLTLNKMAGNQGVKIVLCGDGPDEGMCGYRIFNRLDCFYRDLGGFRWPGVQLKAWINGKTHFRNRDEHFVSLHQFISDEDVKKLRPNTYRKDIEQAFGSRLDLMHNLDSVDVMHKYAKYDLSTYGLDGTLKSEKIGMAASLTVRSPFMMPELQSFIQSVPRRFLVDYQKPFMESTKIILKELCAEEFGAEFAYRDKTGLGIPNHAVFSDKAVRQYVESNLLPSIKNRGVVDYGFVEEIWNLPAKDLRSHNPSLLQVIWCAFSFEIWAQLYLDKSPLDF